MATDVAKAKPVETPAKRERRGLIYFGRFYAVYVVLALALCGGVVGIVLALHGGSSTGPGGVSASEWSKWQPTGSGLGQAEQIAAHVGKEYRLGNGDQLDAVIAKGPIAVFHSQRVRIEYVTVRGQKNAADVVSNTSSTDTLFYSLAGLGASGAILEGTPTAGRAHFVEQEIAELALYTFRYNSAIHDIVAFMPPVGTAQPPIVFLKRSDLGPLLGRPLVKTLRQATTIAAHRIYAWNFQLEQDGSGIFVLTRLQAKLTA